MNTPVVAATLPEPPTARELRKFGPQIQGLAAYASSLGVKIYQTDYDLHADTGMVGYYTDDDRSIVLDGTQTARQMRWTLAHEIGHAFYRHLESSLVNELQANRFAVRLLIDPDVIAATLAACTDLEDAADLLDLDVRYLRLYSSEVLMDRS